MRAHASFGDTQAAITYNEEFEIKREQLRQNELKLHPERFRLLAHSLTQFTPIKKNKYLERKRYVLTDTESKALTCTCQRGAARKNGNQHQSFNCGDNCINRVVSTECCPWTCPCGPYCKNRRFQLHQDAYVFPVKTEKKGWGLFAGEFIPKGSFVMQYVGEVFSVDSDLGQERVNMYKNSTCTYLMRTINNEVIDPTFIGNVARLMNHSCDPNCQTQKWNVLGEVCVGIFSLKDIKENEELTFDYQFDFFKTPFTKCYCGTSKCKGYLGVLATTNSSGGLSYSNSSSSAPYCGYCKKLISEKDSLLVCRGVNKETYHIQCVIKKEGGANKSRAQAFANNLDRKSFFCKVCIKQEKQAQKELSLRRNPSAQVEPVYGGLQLELLPQFQMGSLHKGYSVNVDQTEELTYEVEPLLPWESLDPNVRKFYDETPENRILDQIIAREYDLIEKQMKLKEDGKKKKTAKNQSHLSDFYNFMSELAKRLKQRIRASSNQDSTTSGYKFRRPKELVQSSAKNRRRKNSTVEKPEKVDRRRAPRQQPTSQDDVQMTDIVIPDTINEEDLMSNEVIVDESEAPQINEVEEVESMIESIDDDEEMEEEMEAELSDEEESEEEAQIEESEEEEKTMEEITIHEKLIQQAIQTLTDRPLRSVDKYVSPRRISMNNPNVVDPAKEKQAISQLLQQKILAFVKEQNYLLNAKLEDMSGVRESKINVYETVFNIAVPDFIDDYQCLPNFQIYWDNPWGGIVTLRIISTYKQFNFFTLMLQELTDLLLKSNLLCGVTETKNLQLPAIQYPFEIIAVHVPKNFIRKLVGYQEKNLMQYRKSYSVDFDYCKDLLNDEVFQLNENTMLRIFGSSIDVRYVNEFIQKDLEQIKMKTIFLQMNDCKIIMDNVKEVKVQMDPCEIRIKKMTRDWKDLRHPFYYLPNYFREMVLIGTQKEIDDAERLFERYLSVKRELQKVNMQQISYLLPIQFKSYHNDIKLELMTRYNNHLQVFFYEPTFPRKHLTVLMIGDWKMLLSAKSILESEVNRLMLGKTELKFDSFQRYTYHQQIRFSFKSLKRFVLEKDIKYLNHWDMVSLFVENAGKQRPALMGADTDLQRQLDEKDERDLVDFIKFLKNEDAETCVNALFVLTNSEPEKLDTLMGNLTMRKREVIDMLSQILKSNIDEYRDTLRYYTRYARPMKTSTYEPNGTPSQVSGWSSPHPGKRSPSPSDMFQRQGTSWHYPEEAKKSQHRRKRSESHSQERHARRHHRKDSSSSDSDGKHKKFTWPNIGTEQKAFNQPTGLASPPQFKSLPTQQQLPQESSFKEYRSNRPEYYDHHRPTRHRDRSRDRYHSRKHHSRGSTSSEDSYRRRRHHRDRSSSYHRHRSRHDRRRSTRASNRRSHSRSDSPRRHHPRHRSEYRPRFPETGFPPQSQYTQFQVITASHHIVQDHHRSNQGSYEFKAPQSFPQNSEDGWARRDRSPPNLFHQQLNRFHP